MPCPGHACEPDHILIGVGRYDGSASCAVGCLDILGAERSAAADQGTALEGAWQQRRWI